MKTITAKSFRNVLFVLLLLTGKFSQAQGAGSIGSQGNVINDPCPKADIYDRQAYCGQMQLGGLIFQTTIPVVSYYWSTTGTGTFVPAYNVQNATYVFSHADSVAGSVTILFNVQGALGCLSVASVNLTINNSNPLNDNDPCTVDACNSANGTVTHTPIPNCPGCSNPPTANAGGPYSTSCAAAQLNGTFGGSATGGTWTSTGTGSFIPNANTANASYLPSPADLASGTPKTLTFTSNNPSGAPCVPAVSSTTISFTSLSDNNPCTLDQCDNGVVVHAQVLDGSPGASDGNQCTNDICISGNTVHQPQSGPTAQDGNPCTLEICINGVLQSNPTNLAVTTTSTATTNCLNNGTATATPSGGVTTPSTPYLFLWTPGSQTTATASNLAAGNYTVRVTDNNGCTTTSSVIVGAGTGSLGAPVITGPLTVCRNQTYTYSIVAVPGATSYIWEFPTRATGVVAGNQLSATVTYSGGPGGQFPSPNPQSNDICVTAVGPCGTNKTCIIIGLGTIPAPVITGPLTVCPTQTFTYSIVAVPGATSYNWTFPTRSSHVTAANGLSTVVTFNSNFPSPNLSHNNICVTAVGPCGSSPQVCIQITKGILPSPVITGPTIVCPTQTYTYSIVAVPGATSYTWSFPTRSSHVTAANGLSTVVTYNSNFPSPNLNHNNICVTANSPCGSSPQVCIQISKGLQTAPVITGPILVCRNLTYTYSIVPVPGATSYTWEFPTRSTGTVAPGGLSASVAYTGGPGGQFPSPNPSSNDICVTANGPCGNSQTCVIIGLDPTCPSTCLNPPTANANTTGTPYTACGTTPSASTVSLHGSVGGSATGGTWSAPAGTGSFSNPNNLNTTFTPSQTAINSGSVTLTLTSNNPSGAPCVAATSTAVVTFNALPPTPLTITGPQVVCPGSTVQYCITIPPGSNTTAFHWWIDRTANPSLSFNPQGQPVKIDTVIPIVPGQTTICISVYVPIGYTGGANGQEVEVETLNGPCASSNHKEIDDIFGGNNADDGNACTIDGCNSITGSVTHTPVNTNDANACTIDACNTQSGVITHPPVNVNDGNDCTTDACNTTNGTITHIGTNPDDGNPCTLDACSSVNGSITHTPVNTGDENACTVDACNSITGTITHTAVNVSDGNLCTTDVCNTQSGVITHPPVNVSDGNDCTADACNTSNGSITHTGISADDGNACTNDFCNTATGSVTHTPVVVTDFNECTADICNTQSGAITHPSAPGVSDGDPCTQDVCISSTGAVSHPLVDVNDGNACTTDYCEVPSGSIYHLINYNDGNACTDDFCNTLSGAQTHPTKAGVDDGNACTTDNCNTLTGITTHPAVANGSDGNSDGNACTEDKCLSGQTVYTPKADINDGNVCTNDVCNTSVGTTSHNPVANGSPGATDGNACTDDVCQSGQTAHTPLANINDGNVCTTDVCNTNVGTTSHTPVANGSPGATDGNACTDDICQSGQTAHTPLSNIDDLNVCTTDVCNSSVGTTSHNPVANGTPGASDSNPCTIDVCQSGQTIYPSVDVNDGNACTDDYCEVPSGSIYHLTNFNDGNACTDDFCNTLSGAQTHPTKAIVSDNDECTTDICNTLSGAISHPLNWTSDANLCDIESCNPTNGSVIHTPLANIDDGNACTTDICNSNTGTTQHADYQIKTFTFSGPGAITDNSNVSSIQSIIGDGLYISSPNDLTIAVTMTHTFVGDLKLQLTSPGGTSLLFDRPGVPPGGVGNSMNLNGSYTFNPSSLITLPEVGTGTANDILPGNYQPSNTAGTSHSWDGITFPLSLSGSWTLQIFDLAAGDVGNVSGWSITAKGVTNDGNPCTDDACNPVTGSVTHTPLTNVGGGASDNNLCTLDNCSSGVTVHPDLPNLNDNNTCTTDACNSSTGTVTHSNVIVFIPGTINITGGGSNASTICLNGGSTSRTFDISPNPPGLTLNWKVNDLGASPTTGSGSNFNTDFAGVTIPQPPGNKTVGVIAYYTDANGCKSDSQQTNVQIFTACPPAIVSVDNSGNESTVGSNLVKVGKTNSLEGKNLSMVSLYPNPTSGNATLSFNATNNGKYNISIYDMFGRVLVNEDMQAEEGINTKDFNLENVARGIYFVNIISTIDKEVQTLRLVVE